jgi:anti-sigma regulatory factor (Ser/Thr protein kinase)
MAVAQTRRPLEVIPAARRLISSLRDMGYEFTTAVADLVDNSIEAGATVVTIDVEFEGEDSWVRIADNGRGMTSSALREAMRYGSTRKYTTGDLGKFGLGLKVASLSQCRRLSVASRVSRERAEITAYSWDLGHIERTNRWELIPAIRNDSSARLHAPLKESVGTVVLWQELDRILSCERPGGESARRRLASMCREVEGHLAMVFHRFLSGEARGRPRLCILLNGNRVVPWDPFARDERATRKLGPVNIPVGDSGLEGELTLEPFVLPHQSDFSSPDSFRRASGPSNWNQQQGFYVYRADRLIQSGGWCRIRTLDEHTKLARVALHFSPRLDNAFRVNVSKMRVQLPRSMREQLAAAIAPVTKLANDSYRGGDRSRNGHAVTGGRAINGKVQIFSKANGSDWQHNPPGLPARLTFAQAIDSLLSVATGDERKIIRKVATRLCATRNH